MADILDELLKGGVAPEQLASELRRQMEYGLAGAASGSKRLGPLGAGMREEALGQAVDYRNRADKKAAGEAAAEFERLKMAVQAAEKKADRDQRSADNAANRAMQRELAKLREAGANSRAKIKAKKPAEGGTAVNALAHADEADRLAAHAAGLKERVGFLTSGLVGQVSKYVGGTPARGMEADLDTLMGNLALTKLDEMRRLAAESGAKGSGLGQVTEREIALLQSTIASIDITQPGSQLKRNLDKVREHYKSIGEKMRQLAEEQADLEVGQGEVEGGDPSEEADYDQLMQKMLDDDPALAEAFAGLE